MQARGRRKSAYPDFARCGQALPAACYLKGEEKLCHATLKTLRKNDRSNYYRDRPGRGRWPKWACLSRKLSPNRTRIIPITLRRDAIRSLVDQLPKAVDPVIKQLLDHGLRMYKGATIAVAFRAPEDEVAAEPRASFRKLVTILARKGKRGVLHSFEAATGVSSGSSLHIPHEATGDCACRAALPIWHASVRATIRSCTILEHH